MNNKVAEQRFEAKRSMVEKRLEAEMKDKNTDATLSIVVDGVLGKREYEVNIWGWKVRFRPTVSYPYAPPFIKYKSPVMEMWEDFLVENHVASNTMVNMAMSIVTDNPDK